MWFLWKNKYIFINSYLFALKPFKFTYRKKQLSSIWRHKNSWRAFHFPQHPSDHPLGNEQCLKLLLGVCNTKERGDLSLWAAQSRYKRGTAVGATHPGGIYPHNEYLSNAAALVLFLVFFLCGVHNYKLESDTPSHEITVIRKMYS